MGLFKKKYGLKETGDYALIAEPIDGAYIAGAEDVAEAVPKLSGGGITFDRARVETLLNAKDASRAYDMGALGVGVANLFSTVAPWELPALRKATRGKLFTDLKLFDLLGLWNALGGVQTASVYVLPAQTGAARTAAASETMLRSIFR